MGSAAIRGWLGIAVRWSRDRGKPTRVFPQPDLLACGTLLAVKTRCHRRWIFEAFLSQAVSCSSCLMPEIKTIPTILEAIRNLLEGHGTAVLATLVDSGEGVGAKILVQDGVTISGSIGDGLLDDAIRLQATAFFESRDDAYLVRVEEFAPELLQWGGTQVLLERIQAEPEIVICGAGHVGASLAKLAVALHYQVTLIDDRVEFLLPDRFPAERVRLFLAKRWADAVRETIGAGRGVSVAIVTRGHKEDEECLRAVIETTPDYVGLIGSTRRTRIVLERLRAAGAAEEKLQLVHAPIGLDIGAVTPEEVALAILAEVVAKRRGGKGGSLSSGRK